MRVLMVARAACFSPNSVERDKAIFEAVAERLRQQGCWLRLISEDQLDVTGSIDDVDLILTMARRLQTLAWLRAAGIRTVNDPMGIENCARKRLQTIMEYIGTPVAPSEGMHGYWLKRGDSAAQTSSDVVFVHNDKDLAEAIRQMKDRGISDYTVSAHVVGDLVKFYGVSGTGFFRYFYPTDDGESKFGDEHHNDPAHHYPFSVETLQGEAERLAEAVGIQVWGGDAIIKPDGTFCLIDFNDWPSFSRCCEEAVEAIVKRVKSEKYRVKN